MKISEGRSKSNACYFIMLAGNIRGGCWWYGSAGQADKMASGVEVHVKEGSLHSPCGKNGTH